MIRIEPGTVSGRVAAPPSKSVTHRAYVLASQAYAPCVVAGPLRSGDCDATLAGLHRLGARIELADSAVRFEPAPFAAPTEPLDCRNSGTTLRLLGATAARLGAPVRLVGDASLSRRTSEPLWAALRSLGAKVECRDGKAPVQVSGPLRPGAATLPPHGSSQFASALALSLHHLDAPSTLSLAAPIDSAPYLDLTHAMALRQGLRIERSASPGGETWTLHPSKPRGGRIAVEGDWSSAALHFAAAAVTGGEVEIAGLDPDSLQPDRAILGHLRSFGCSAGPTSLRAASLASPGTLHLTASPDLLPILAVVAACARGTTRLIGGPQLRNKESDRLTAMADGLRRLSVDAREEGDTLVVAGGGMKGAALASHGDHRVHMALCVAALAAKGASTLDGEATAAVSYPGFHADLARLGARIFKDGSPLEVAA